MIIHNATLAFIPFDDGDPAFLQLPPLVLSRAHEGAEICWIVPRDVARALKWSLSPTCGSPLSTLFSAKLVWYTIAFTILNQLVPFQVSMVYCLLTSLSLFIIVPTATAPFDLDPAVDTGNTYFADIRVPVLALLTDDPWVSAKLMSSHHFTPLWPHIILMVALGSRFPVSRPFSEVGP